MEDECTTDNQGVVICAEPIVVTAETETPRVSSDAIQPSAGNVSVGKRETSGWLPQKDDSKYIICQGRALVYAGNPRHVGRTGGMLRPIRPGAAAIIPRQWTGSRTAGPLLRSQGALIGGVTGGGQRFSGLDDTAGNTDLGPGPQQVLIDRADGGLYIELVTGRHEGASSVTLAIPKDGGLSYPQVRRRLERADAQIFLCDFDDGLGVVVRREREVVVSRAERSEVRHERGLCTRRLYRPLPDPKCIWSENHRYFLLFP